MVDTEALTIRFYICAIVQSYGLHPPPAPPAVVLGKNSGGLTPRRRHWYFENLAMSYGPRPAADRQQAADAAAKAAADAAKASDQQAQAVTQAQADLGQLQAAIQQARDTEKARKAAEEAARVQKEREAEAGGYGRWRARPGCGGGFCCAVDRGVSGW